MKWWRFTFLVVVVAVIQISAAMNLVALTNLRIKPDIFLILLVYFAVNCDSFDAIIISFALGFAADITGMVLGPHLISYGIIGTSLAHIKKIILLKTTGRQAMAIFITAMIAQTAALILTRFKAAELINMRVVEIFAVAAYSAILWFLVKWPVTKAGKWLDIGIHRFGLRVEQR